MSNHSETVYVQVMPVWARIAFVVAVSGLPHYTIRKLFNDGQIRARKVESDKANSATVYRVQDVFDWLEKEAHEPPPYKLPEVRIGIVESTTTKEERNGNRLSKAS